MRAVFLALVATVVLASPAQAAEFGIAPGGFTVSAIDAEGNPETRAGAYPHRFTIDLILNVEDTGTTARDIEFDLPPGLGSYTGSVPECPRAQFDKGEEECPPESQVGKLTFAGEFDIPLFAVESRPGEAAAFGSKPGVDLPTKMELRPSDNGITFKGNDLPQIPISESRIELWGVPADSQQGTAIPRRPFLALPGRCGPVAVSVRVRSWEPGAPWLNETAQTPSLSGCEELRFEPRLGLQLTNPLADSPTGARIELTLPDDLDPDGQASAQIRNMNISLPEGITMSPASAEGLTVCSDAQLGLGTASEPSCPASSKVGTLEYASPALRAPLTGDIYLGEERPGERFRTFIVARGPDTLVKSAGAMQMDPSTGRLAMEMRGLPQVPLSRLTLNMDGGAQSLLVTPLECGPATSVARFEPYSGGAPVESVVSTQIGSLFAGLRCPGLGPFSPTVTLDGGTVRAGGRVELSTRVLRRDGEQLPRRFAMTLPAGLNTALGKIETCPDSMVAARTCPPASRIGGVVAVIGSGPRPSTLRGEAFLTGPYRGAPFGLLQVFRIAVGPFDLGTSTIRAAMQMNRDSGRVTVLTDRMPAAIDGMPVRFRSIGLEMGREGFVFAPTSCRPTGLDVTIESMAGESIERKVPLEVTGCKRLGFKPRLSLALTGRSELHRGGNPGLRTVSRLRRGDANLRAMSLTFPRALTFNVAAVKEICARRSALEGECPARSRVGRAIARSPLLDKPLRGAMYMVQPQDDGLPDLWLGVEAMGVNMSLTGRTTVRDGRLSIKLAGLADVPLSAFTMRTPQGKHGVFSLSTGLCDGDRPRRFFAAGLVKGQNGKQRRLRIPFEANPRCR